MAPESSDLPILYSFRRCPYAMRARMALLYAGIRVELREVFLRDKPSAMLQVSTKGTVPVLLLKGGEVLDESLDIMFWALAQNDPENWLPACEKPVAAMMQLIADNDGDFKRHLDCFKYPERFRDVEPELDPQAHCAQAAEFIDALEMRLEGAAYLFGTAPSLADIAVFPFVRQFAGVDANRFAAAPYPCVRAWLGLWKDSTLFYRAMHRYPVWHPQDKTVYLG